MATYIISLIRGFFLTFAFLQVIEFSRFKEIRLHLSKRQMKSFVFILNYLFSIIYII